MENIELHGTTSHQGLFIRSSSFKYHYVIVGVWLETPS